MNRKCGAIPRKIGSDRLQDQTTNWHLEPAILGIGVYQPVMQVRPSNPKCTPVRSQDAGISTNFFQRRLSVGVARISACNKHRPPTNGLQGDAFGLPSDPDTGASIYSRRPAPRPSNWKTLPAWARISSAFLFVRNSHSMFNTGFVNCSIIRG